MTKPKTKTKFAPMKITGFFEPAPPQPQTQPQHALTEQDIKWMHYFGFDGTCLEHDLLSCRLCKRLATGRCISRLEEL
jgi:hypothetical protein